MIYIIVAISAIWFWRRYTIKTYEKVVLVSIVIIAALWFFVVNIFIVEPLKMVGKDMSPTLSNGQLMFINKLSTNNLKRGDIITFWAKDNTRLLIKRIIGLPNEKVAISRGQVLINGSVTSEPYVPNGTYTQAGSAIAEDSTIDIPANEYFVLGDNRDNSKDSREWGTLPKENITGTFWFKY